MPASQRGIVEFEAGGGGLFSFEAISEQFPIGERGGQLSYAQGTTMIDDIIDRYGREAIARIAAAYRDGASDAEALEAGTGVTADAAVCRVLRRVRGGRAGADRARADRRVERRPPCRRARSTRAASSRSPWSRRTPAPGESPPDDGGSPLPVLLLLAVAAILAVGGAIWVARRAERRSG